MKDIKMIKVYQSLFFLLKAASLVTSYCPRGGITSIGACAFRIRCSGNIRGVSLPDNCRGSPNQNVTIDLTLTDAIERFDNHILDVDFLSLVTSFRASANWTSTSLSFLTYMPKLRTLVLTDDNIQNIEGTPFFTLKYLQYLDLSRNAIADIEEMFQFEAKNSLKRLNLAHNAIDELSGDTFCELKNLKELDLSHNLITNLDEEPFFNLTNLEILRLNNNKIKDLNGALNSLVNLKHLYLRGNEIENIDESSLKIIQHLVTFDVSGNQLNKLKPIMFSRHWQHFGGTCKIILSENHITSIPNGTSKELSSRFSRDLRHKIDVLTELDLSKNDINNVEYNAFQSIVQLTSLDLSVNNLTNFIVNSKHFRDLKYLNLSSNHITNLYYETFTAMKNLQNLDLAHNSLTYIPEETFSNNVNLKYLNFTFNKFTVLKNLRVKIFHPDGGVLDLSNNELTHFGIPFGESLRLTVLVLNSNKIDDAAEINLGYQGELKILQVSRNNLKKLNNTSLLLPVSLTSLDLSRNKLEEIGPSTFHRVTHLKDLHLDHNELTDIQFGAFRGLTDLSNLDLSYNNIKYLDSKVLMDLKTLSVLSLRSNGLYELEYKSWFGHKTDLKVYLEDNSFSCDWLSDALRDYNNGYSKMRPTVQEFNVATSKHTLEGIPCEQDDSNEVVERSQKQIELSSSQYVLADERLLVTNQKILEAVREQTYYLRSFMNQFNVNHGRDLMERLRKAYGRRY